MNVFTNYLEKLGNNFLVAAMIPSLGLVISCMFVFDPILHIAENYQIDEGIYSLLGISPFVAVPTIIIGFTLTALNTFILKFFEGYVFFHRFPFMRNAHTRKANRLIERREAIKKEIEWLNQNQNKTQEQELLLSDLKTSYYTLVAIYDQLYPPTNAEIMPTRFGNILKASEAYSGTRYGIDAVQFWPRLWHVIPTSYRQTIDDARNELSFLVNMSTLSTVFYILCFLAILTNASSFFLDTSAAFENSSRYFLSGLVAIFFTWFFNKAALFSVGDFGIMIRSAYDLFRLDLLEQFRLKHPKDSVEEFRVWKNLGELIVLGQESLEFEPLQYEIKKRDKK